MSVFPEGFMWGAATAAHQVEGNQQNNWSEWESTVAEELAETAEERLRDTVPRWDLIKGEATNPDNYISGIAANHYDRFEEDFDLMQKLGLKAYRFSIEWSRIEPESGIIDEEEITHYKEVIQALKARNIEPIVSLHHFTNPVWFDEGGGWHKNTSVERFTNYAHLLAKELPEVTYWSTINEPGSYLLMRYLGGGIWPKWPELETNFLKAYRCLRNFVKAHKRANKAIKSTIPAAKVGMVHGMVDFSLERKDPLSWMQYRLNRYIPDGYIINRIKDDIDYIGVNYYVHMKVKSRFSSVRGWTQEGADGPENDMGWSIHPEGIYHVTQRLHEEYGLPMVITENGLPDKRDEYRKKFIQDHLKWVKKSIDDGADIRGYLHWSLLDNYEWSEGYWPKFGLIAVNRNTMERTVRKSAYDYKRFIDEYSTD